jgi:hypothetical protein
MFQPSWVFTKVILSWHVINKKERVDKKMIKRNVFFCLALNYNGICVMKGDLNV